MAEIEAPPRATQWPFEKALGLLAGAAAGDALGAVVEGIQREDIVEIFGRVDGPFEQQDVPWYQNHPELVARYWRAAGVHTDDTQQLLCLLDCFLETGEFEAGELARRLQASFPYARGHGRGWRTFYKNMKRGLWPPAMPHNAGAGSSVRASVLGLLVPPEEDEYAALNRLVGTAVAQSCLTQSDVRAHWAAAMIAVAAWRMLQLDPKLEDRQPVPDSLPASILTDLCSRSDHVQKTVRQFQDPGDFAELTAQFMEGMEAVVARADADHPGVRGHGNDFLDGVGAIAAIAEKSKGAPAFGTANFALETPLTALFTLIWFQDSVEEAGLAAVNLGGDTDSLACMVGAMRAQSTVLTRTGGRSVAKPAGCNCTPVIRGRAAPELCPCGGS